MGSLTSADRRAHKSIFPFLILVGTFMLATTLGFASSPTSETIQAAYPQAGNTINVTPIIFSYSTPSDLQILSQAYKEGQDQGLATALSRTQPVGRCLITGGSDLWRRLYPDGSNASRAEDHFYHQPAASVQ